MKVVSGPSKWTKKVACSTCKSELEVELDDVLIGKFDGNAWEEGNNEPYCVCSVCESRVRLGRDCPPVVWRVGIENVRRKHGL